MIKPFLKRICFGFFCLRSLCLIITSVSSSGWSNCIPDLRMTESELQKQNKKSKALALKKVKSLHSASSVCLSLAKLLEFCAALCCELRWMVNFHTTVQVCMVLYS